MKKCEFEKGEYYSNYENKKIKLLCYLNKEGILDINNCGNLQNILDDIKNDLEIGLISKRKLEDFLYKKRKIAKKDDNKNEEGKKYESNEKDKNEIIQKLGLIKIILNDYDPFIKYGDLIKTITEINTKIDDLNYIKNSLIIFHRNKHIKDIQKITNIINNIETKPIKEFRSQEMKQSIEELLKLKATADEVNKVRDFLLFKKIFEKAQGKDQSERFKDGITKLNKLKDSFKNNSTNIEEIFKDKDFEKIFTNIKEELSKKEESKSDKFIEQMEDYFDVKDDSEKNNLKIMIKSKKYEMVVKSIKFFF
jgi:hypothetical protein